MRRLVVVVLLAGCSGRAFDGTVPGGGEAGGDVAIETGWDAPLEARIDAGSEAGDEGEAETGTDAVEEVQTEAATDATDATGEPEACVPHACETLGYVCGTENSDGCGGVLVCGPAYERHVWEDWPWVNTDGGVSCPENRPHSWSCGNFVPPGGDPPYPDCVHFPGYATWCCAESS